MSEYKNLIVKNFDDAEYLHEVAILKRAAEYYTLDKDFHAAFEKNSEQTLAEYGLAEVDVQSARLLLLTEVAEKFKDTPFEKFPRQFRRYKKFMAEKLELRNKLRHEDCKPTNKIWANWRARQIIRCWFEMGARNLSMVHTPVMFELAKGCSVGCPFCGLMAPPLTKIFRYTDENAAFWKNILRVVYEFTGSAGGAGTLYYASEPLDNPDYTRFVGDYFEIFRHVPQVTTAASTRNVERTRSILKFGYELEPHIDRFSVLNKKMRDKIFESFTPEELVPVELLPQFADAPNNHFSAVGKARAENQDTGDTIACLSGVVINLAEKTVTLATPRNSDKAHPTGQKIYAVENFADAEDLRKVLSALIEKYMPAAPDYSADLKLHAFVHLAAENDRLTISGSGYKMTKTYDENSRAAMVKVAAYLEENRHGSIRGLARDFYDEVEPAYTISVVKNLWRLGVFED